MVQWHRGAFRTGMVQRTVVAFRSVRQDATSEGAVQKLRSFCTAACPIVTEGCGLTSRHWGAYQPVDEVQNWPSTHNMSRPKLRMTTLWLLATFDDRAWGVAI